MSTKDYLIGNLSIILCDAPYIYVCASLSDISKVEDSSSNFGFWYYVIIGISIFIVIVVIILVYYFSKKELTKTLKEIKEQRKQEQNSEERSVQSSSRSQPERTGRTITENVVNVKSKSGSDQNKSELESENGPKNNSGFIRRSENSSSITPISEQNI